jgi:hypothetical protein
MSDGKISNPDENMASAASFFAPVARFIPSGRETAMEPEGWKARLRDPFPKWTPQLAEPELAHSL